jgi:hypothetical protein
VRWRWRNSLDQEGWLRQAVAPEDVSAMLKSEEYAAIEDDCRKISREYFQTAPFIRRT